MRKTTVALAIAALASSSAFATVPYHYATPANFSRKGAKKPHGFSGVSAAKRNKRKGKGKA